MSAYACALPHRLRAARRLALVLVRKRILLRDGVYGVSAVPRGTIQCTS
jgi:hypothetical protein